MDCGATQQQFENFKLNAVSHAAAVSELAAMPTTESSPTIVTLSLPSGGLQWSDNRLLADGQTGYGGGQTLLPYGAERTRQPHATGDQCGQEPSVSSSRRCPERGRHTTSSGSAASVQIP